MDEVQELCRRVLGPGPSADEAAAQARADQAHDRLALLARARLRLRSERRGTEPEPGPDCGERDRARRVLACRRDSEPLSAQDDAWLLAHLARCTGCEMAHAAMLEASVCYRAWPAEAEPTQPMGLAEPGVGADAAR